MILTPQYFLKRPVLVPKAQGVGNGTSTTLKTSDEALIQGNIDTYEIEFLKYLLGRDLAKEFITAYKASVQEDNPVELEQKWKDLISHLYDEDELTSPAANYVYWFILKEMYAPPTRIGTFKAKTEEGLIYSPISDQVNAWNIMCDELIDFYVWLADNVDTYEHDDVYIDPKEGIIEAYYLIDYKNTFGI